MENTAGHSSQMGQQNATVTAATSTGITTTALTIISSDTTTTELPVLKEMIFQRLLKAILRMIIDAENGTSEGIALQDRGSDLQRKRRFSKCALWFLFDSVYSAPGLRRQTLIRQSAPELTLIMNLQTYLAFSSVRSQDFLIRAEHSVQLRPMISLASIC